VKKTSENTYTKEIGLNTVRAVAHANIALVKYWGKRNVSLNLPAVGSLSITLDALKTETTVQADESLQKDKFILNGKYASDDQILKIGRFLDFLYELPDRPKLVIDSKNNFPTGAGLASSASGFAALTMAASGIYGKEFDRKQLSKIARQGSGSAARSLFGGFVEMKCGEGDTGDEDYAVQLYGSDYWDVRMLIAITSHKKKPVGSTAGMTRTAETSPFYSSWVKSSAKDIENMKQALEERNFEKMGILAEHSSFKMHGLALSANPPLLYWNATTTETIHKIWQLRENRIPAYITMDAGPQVKVLCLPEQEEIIQNTLKSIEGVENVISARPGPGAYKDFLK